MENGLAMMELALWQRLTASVVHHRNMWLSTTTRLQWEFEVNMNYPWHFPLMYAVPISHSECSDMPCLKRASCPLFQSLCMSGIWRMTCFLKRASCPLFQVLCMSGIWRMLSCVIVVCCAQVFFVLVACL